MRKQGVVITFIFILQLCSTIYSASLEFTEISRKELGNLPFNKSEPTFAIANGYIGIVTAKDENNRFVLFDTTGRERFSIRPDSGFFYFVEMKNSCDIIFLSITESENVSYEAYDFTGHLVFRINRPECYLRMSPKGQYFYTRNNFIEGYYPQIFGRGGELLAQLSPESYWWQLTPLSDSCLIFQDGPRIRILAVPSLNVIKELMIENISPPSGIMMEVSKSPEGDFYAFCAMDKIVICDLTNYSVSFIDDSAPDSVHICPSLALGPHGKYLLCLKSIARIETIYVRENTTWRRLIDNSRIPFNFHFFRPAYGGPILTDNYIAINYFVTATPHGLKNPISYLRRVPISDRTEPIVEFMDAYIYEIKEHDSTFLESLIIDHQKHSYIMKKENISEVEDAK
jgi:hypothetical protein